MFLSRWYPYPPDNGSKIRILSLLHGLAQYHDVTLLSFANGRGITEASTPLESLCRQIRLVPWRPYDPHRLRAMKGFLSATPRSLVDTHSPNMEQQIVKVLAADDYDLVIASEIDMARYAPLMGDLPALFEDVEVGVLYDRFASATSVVHRLRQGLTWAKHRRYLSRLVQEYNACTVVSRREQQLLRSLAPYYRDIEIIPNCVHLDDYMDVPRSVGDDTLIFCGSFTYRVNHDAMVWFLRQAYPIVRARIPNVSLTITGNNAGLPLPECENVSLTGYVDDVRPLIAASSISIAPILEGGGTRLKILEAMVLRTPVVATSKGAEGLDVQHGAHVLLGDTPEAFADAVVRLLQDPGLRQRLADNGYRLVRERYNWDSVMPAFLGLVERVGNA